MTDMKYSRLDLKVCEGCGTLWLRTITSTTVYCRRCATRLSGFPPPRGKRNGGRKPRLARVGRHHHAETAQGASPACALAGGVR